MLDRWRRFYGANPLHLLALLASFALAGYAILRASAGPLPGRMLVWFVGAIIGHDLILYPLYALSDRSLTSLLRRRRRPQAADPGAVNYVRAPALFCGLLLVMFWPVITGHAEPAYRSRTGLPPTVYLGRWLLLSGAAFAASALFYAMRTARHRPRRPHPASGTEPLAGP